jgi:hypothetical protein
MRLGRLKLYVYRLIDPFGVSDLLEVCTQSASELHGEIFDGRAIRIQNLMRN